MTAAITQRDPLRAERFLEVHELTRLLGISDLTLYRMINDRSFPAVRIRTRLVVPSGVVDEFSGQDPVQHPPLGPGLLEVGVVARIMRVAPETLYRLIRDGGFPAKRLRGRVLVPGAMVDEMATAAIKRGSLVDPVEWVDQTTQAVGAE